MIEDQVSPKKCGHTRGKQVISRDEARMKIRAAVDARAGADILIMARTDARAVHGFEEALAAAAISRKTARISSSRSPRAKTRCGVSAPR